MGVGHDESVMYAGSTTGPSHNNEICSPYFISWHVDKRCHKVNPASFDNLCRQMKEVYGLESDLYPRGSRKIPILSGSFQRTTYLNWSEEAGGERVAQPMTIMRSAKWYGTG